MRPRRSVRGLVLAAAVAVVVQLLGMLPAEAATAAAQTVPGMQRLNDVWCTPGPTCLGVGVTTQDQGGVVVLAPSGPIGPVRAVAGTAELWSVTCSTAGTCLAVGEGPSSGVVVELAADGTPVAVRSTATNALYGVACPTATTCLAVGTVQTVSDSYPYLIGTSWYVVITNGQPGRARAFSSEAGPMTGISCPSSTRCVAVGNATIALLSSVNGAWTPTLSRSSSSWPTGAGYPTEDISCPTATQCYATAAGFIVSGGGHMGVPAMMPVSADGVPGPVRILSSGSGHTNGISCVGSGTCTVVGRDNDTDQGISIDVARGRAPVVTFWVNADHFMGVSCVTAESCGIAGTNLQSGVFGPKAPAS